MLGQLKGSSLSLSLSRARSSQSPPPPPPHAITQSCKHRLFLSAASARTSAASLTCSAPAATRSHAACFFSRQSTLFACHRIVFFLTSRQTPLNPQRLDCCASHGPTRASSSAASDFTPARAQHWHPFLLHASCSWLADKSGLDLRSAARCSLLLTVRSLCAQRVDRASVSFESKSQTHESSPV